MRCDCLCCVMSRDAVRCHGDELLSVVPCKGMKCYELKMPLVVRSRGVVGSGSVTTSWSNELSVLQSLTPVCTTKVLLQYYSVIRSTTAVLLCTTKYYSSTTLYYTVLLQHYSVPRRPTPVLLCTTKYYSRHTLYYKVLLQYYSVLKSTAPVLQYSVLKSTATFCSCTAPVLLCTTKYYFSTTPYYKVHTAATTPVLQSTTTYYSSTTLYYKAALMIDPWHIWKIHLQCAEQQESPSNFTKYCACHAKWISWLIRLTYEESFTMRGASKVTLQTHQVLRLPRSSEFKIWARNPLNCFRRYKDDSRIIRTESDHKIVISHPPLRRPYTRLDLGDDFVLTKYNISALRLSPKMSRNAAAATKSHSPPSPNTAPATKTHTPPSPLTAPPTENALLLFSTLFSWHLFSKHLFSKHLFSLGIYSLRIYSLWASIFSWHLYASILSHV